MRHHNSVFHAVLQHVPWHEFDRLVAAHRADAGVRCLTTKSQLVALLYGQFSGASSLREIVTGLESHAARLYHLGADPVRRSTLSDANARRPSAVFAELLACLMRQAHRGLRRKLAETVYLVDATSVRLNAHSAGWARFSAGVCGASDRIGFLPARQANNRHNPMSDAVREVRVKSGTGKILRLLSNDLDATAQEIAELYKRRWAIELFFRWVKQTLRITRFLGTSDNAVRIQIAVALIAFLLLRLAQAVHRIVDSPLAFARLVRANLMHRRRIDRLLQPDQVPQPNPAQLPLQWN